MDSQQLSTHAEQRKAWEVGARYRGTDKKFHQVVEHRLVLWDFLGVREESKSRLCEREDLKQGTGII